MPRNFLVKRRSSAHQGAWSDDDVIASPLPVFSHESPDSGYCAHSPLSSVKDESTLHPTNDTSRDVTAGPPPPCLMTSSAAVLRTATSFYQQLMLRRHAETILAAAAKTRNTSLLPTGSSYLMGTGSSSNAGLFPVCSLPPAPYLIPAALGNGAVALNLSSRARQQPAEPKTASTADDTGERLVCSNNSNINNNSSIAALSVTVC